MVTLEALRARALLLAPATLLDAATAAPGATQRFCNPPGCCSCCFWGHATLLQHSWALQLLPSGPRNAPATLPDAVTVASGATRRFRNAPRRCNCCFWATQRNCCIWVHTTLLQRFQHFRTLQPQNGPHGPLPCARALRGFATWPPRNSSPGRCNCPRDASATLLGTT